MRRDFYEYLTSVQKQYNETLKVLEKVNKELKEGLCTEQQRNSFEQYFLAIQANYERLMYVEHLLALPPKWIQKIANRKLIKEQEKFIKAMADRESVERENQDNLDNINNLLNEINSEGDSECKSL